MKKFKKVKNAAVAAILAVGVELSACLTALPARADTAADKINVLTNTQLSVTQDGSADIPVGGTIDSTKPINVKVSFGVPVRGDFPDSDSDPDCYVSYGDTADFELSNAFEAAPSGTVELKTQEAPSYVIGHVTFKMGGADDKTVVAHVIFDGDILKDENISKVTGEFEADFKCVADGNSGNESDQQIKILAKTYTLHTPAAEIAYNLTKTGTVDLSDKSITWTATITATQAGKAIDLAGYQFSDNLKNVGTYRADSFKVGPDSNNLSSETPQSNGEIISYTFPGHSTSPQTVQFKTEIPDNKYYTNTSTQVSNTASLLDSKGTEVTDGTGSVPVNPQWITKTGLSSDAENSGDYNPVNRTITWTITANQSGASLKNVIITDKLPDGLTFVSAKLSKADGTNWTIIKDSINPNENGEYALGEIDYPVLLEITTKVPDENYTTGVTNYSNSASIKWDDLNCNGIGTDNVSVGIGYAAITKSGKAETSTQTVHWTVTVDPKGQAQFPDSLTVYDLLVYGKKSDNIDFKKVTGIPDGISTDDLTPQYGQKYNGNFTGNGSVKSYTIKQDGKEVADLVEIIGLSNNASNTFSFDSKVVDPDVFAGNGTTKVNNTATLFSGTTKINAAPASVDYPSHMLAKEMLVRGTTPTDAASVNGSHITTDATKGFNYADRSVIFRLSVNADGIGLSNFTDAEGALGAVNVQDTLPEGWVFEPLTDQANYLIFAGNNNTSGTSVQATGSPLTAAELTSGGISADSFVGNNTATFTFNSLAKPYAILVRAKPTDETAAGYFSKNETTKVANSATLKAGTNWETGVTATQKVSIVSTVVGKSEALSSAGVVQWAVEYHPYGLENLTATKLVDTLPDGIDLRTDAKGALLLDDGTTSYITANEMTLNSDGSYTKGDAMPLKVGAGGNVAYDNTNRQLTFLIPDQTKAYRFTYLTDVTGEPSQITNDVALYGVSSNAVQTNAQYTITAADGSATLQRNGFVLIAKQGSGSSLDGAEFTLFAENGQIVIRHGTTANGGALKLRAIPVGSYILRETQAPSGYAVEGVDHKVVVTKDPSGKITTSIDGTEMTNSEGSLSNALTVKDYHENTAGNLTISKTIAGNAAVSTDTFTFQLTLTGSGANTNGTYSYVGSGVPSGTISIVNGVGTFELAGGQRITILGLPAGAGYQVKETDSLGYSMSSTEANANIKPNETVTASFTNTKNIGGGGWTPPDDSSSTPGTPSAPGGTSSITGGTPSSPAGTVSTGPAALYLKKADQDGKALSGAEFTLFDANGKVVRRQVTGSGGVVAFKELPAGSYVVRETKAPANYELYDGALNVTLSAGQQAGYTLKDTRKGDDSGVAGWTTDSKLPKTGGTPLAPFAILCGLLLIGAGVIVRRGAGSRGRQTGEPSDRP